MDRRALGWLLFLTSVTWHLWWVVSPPDAGGGPVKRTAGRDYASYHYAAVVASSGGDPWSAEALSAAARIDGTRDTVHPFFYPPPALLLVAWSPAVDLQTGFALWKGLNELALLLCGLVLWRWWRPLGPVVPVAVAVWIALSWAAPYGFVMGQVNPLVLLAVLAGLWQVDSDRPLLGGALVGLACMVKMSPALFVAWWLIERRGRAVGAAIGVAVALSLVALPLAGPTEQLRFYTEILPAFGSGDYNGLVVKISMFANHSLPNLWDQLWPSDGRLLSATARTVSTVSALVLVGALGLAFRRPATDRWTFAARAGAVAVLALLLPVYTYEHHLVQALPAGILLTVAIAEGRLHRAWAPLLGLAAVALAWPHPELKALARSLDGPAGWILQEMKTGALLLLLAGTTRLGTTPTGSG